MPQTNAKQFKWTKRRTEAAMAIAIGVDRDTDIAKRAGVHVATLWRWEQHPEFQARVAEHRAALNAEVRAEGIADRQYRINKLNEDFQDTERIKRERAAYFAAADDAAPGAETGLLVKEERIIGQGQRQREVVHYTFDDQLVARRQSLSQQAAKEVGEWLDKSESKLTVDINNELQRLADELGMTLDEVSALYIEGAARLAGEGK